MFNFKNTYVDLPEDFYTKIKPSKVKNPKIVIYNEELSESLNIDKNVNEEILSGNKIEEKSVPIAQAYAGHQFGHFTMLGDGRAILLGEIETGFGERYDIQLKGAGRTVYSRGGDGRAALSPMLREYIISEAMNSLGIKTTRSLAVVETGDDVYRQKVEKGAVLTRVARSHIRVGTFQYARGLNNKDELKSLADYTIKRHYKNCEEQENPYLSFLKAVILEQAKLVASWNLIGFIHGVMNTDNISIAGETIDYGPCAFMNEYSKDTVFSSIDTYGRYSYGNQANILGWNLARFAESLLPLIHDDSKISLELAKAEMEKYPSIYEELWLDGMRKKLGLFISEENDKELINMLLTVMESSSEDYTNTFRFLTEDNIKELGMVNREDFKVWYGLWKERLARENKSRIEVESLMKSVNPFVIPRNNKVEEALIYAAEFDDLEPLKKLLTILKNPYNYDNNIAKEYLEGNKDSSYRTFCGT